MDLLELLRKGGMDGDVDFLREALRVLVEGIMDAEVSARTGAEYGERSPERVNPVRRVCAAEVPLSWPTRNQSPRSSCGPVAGLGCIIGRLGFAGAPCMSDLKSEMLRRLKHFASDH